MTTATDFWVLIHAERARLADMLDGLSAEQWRSPSLCAAWTVEQVTAHLTAAARTGTWAWIRSIVRAGLNADTHNARLLARYLGRTPEETLTAFRDSVALTIAPTKDYAAFLGEVIVHGQDMARPLGIELTPDPVAVREVADFFVAKDFAVHSRSAVKGLRLDATDAAISTGSGPVVRGRLLDLVMAMAGRTAYCAELSGDGVDELRRRLG
ncbi:maleylpyruvate isomerase family mycothiol-dependent enzyme [Micropruina sp.]|uniref:maleylpyruvate isomerase family mycothiol-dependent enzyme n=1 Tax=Micropruina sp. TaxID=2737536 RepID=UPI0039E40B44